MGTGQWKLCGSAGVSHGKPASHGMGGHQGLASGSVWARAPGQVGGAAGQAVTARCGSGS